MKLKADIGTDLFLFCNLLTNATFKCYLLSRKFTWVMTKLKPWQQYTLSYTRKTLLFMFQNCHVNFHSCYFMTRKLTPGIQEVNSQPVYLPDGMVQIVWTQFQWICGQVSLYMLWFKSSFKFFKLVWFVYSFVPEFFAITLRPVEKYNQTSLKSFWPEIDLWGQWGVIRGHTFPYFLN